MNEADAKVDTQPQQNATTVGGGGGVNFQSLKGKVSHYCSHAYHTGKEYVMRNAWQLVIRLIAIYFLFFFLSQVFTFIKPVPLYLAFIFTVILAFLRV